MKKLFSDNVVSRLRVLPSAVWVLFTFMTFFFSRAYELLVTGEYVMSLYVDILVEAGLSAKAGVVYGVFVSIGSALIETLIFELILHIAYGVLAGRYRAEINKSDFKFRLRYLMIVINLVIGILAIGYFFTQTVNGVHVPQFSLYKNGFVNLVDAENPYYLVQDACMPILVVTLLVMAFYEDFRKRYVPKRNQAKLFAWYGILYVGVEVILYVINLVRALLQANVTFGLYDILSYSLEAGAFVLIGVVYFFYWRKLKKEEDIIEPTITFPDEDSGGTDGNIFNDFGF